MGRSVLRHNHIHRTLFAGMVLLLLSAALICVCPETLIAADSADTSKADSIMDSIVSFELRQSGVEEEQKWVEEILPASYNPGYEWFIIAMRQDGREYDFGAYGRMLSEYLSTKTSIGAVTRQKYSLCLIAAGMPEDAFVAKTANETIGQQGIMSLVFGLNLLNSGCSSEKYTCEQVADELLKLKLADGGWALRGETADVDVTAMVLQCLAPYYNGNVKAEALVATIGTAVDEAVAILSERQLETGDYIGFEEENAESTAQVITALAALNIDYLNDERFIKNGCTLFDGLQRYQLEDGSFSHTLGGSSNITATVQAYYSCVAVRRAQKGLGQLFVIRDEAENGTDEENTESYEVTEGTDDTENIEDRTESEETEKEEDRTESESAEKEEGKMETESAVSSYKPVVIGVILGVALIAVLICFLRRRGRKSYFSIIIVTGLAAAFVLMTDFYSAESYYRAIGKDIDENADTVTLSIQCGVLTDMVDGKYIYEAAADNKYIPEDGVILAATEFAISEKDTVYDVLVKAARQNEIHIESEGTVSGNSSLAYINGINYIYELQYGELSGWIYSVNGQSPSVGCGACEVSDGDIIVWQYTIE